MRNNHLKETADIISETGGIVYFRAAAYSAKSLYEFSNQVTNIGLIWIRIAGPGF